MTIPTKCQDFLFKSLGISLKRGEKQPITIQILNYTYDDALIINQKFDDKKYKGRNDIIQIRYNPNSLLAKTLRNIFSSTTNFVDHTSNFGKNATVKNQIPEDKLEYIDVYVKCNILYFDCAQIDNPINNSIINNHSFVIPKKRDISTSVFTRSASLIEIAKLKAKGICQLCGKPAPFNDKQGKPYLEVHHIVWLSRGGTDTLDNVIAICPNCHSKMHIVNNQQDVQHLLKAAKELYKD